MSNNEIEFIKQGAFDNFPKLRRLNLLNNNIPIEHLFSFGNHTQLEELILGNDEILTAVSTHSIFSISNYYPNLRRLHLSGVGAKSILSQNWNRFVPNLQVFYIRDNPKIDLQSFFQNFPLSLKTLSIKKSYLENVTVAKLHNLETLKFVDNDFRSLHFTDELEVCKSNHQICVGPMNNLKHLWLDNCNISLLKIQLFNQDVLPKLSTLALRKNNLKTVSFLPTRDIWKFRSLESLYLDWGDLKCPIQKIICLFPDLKYLYARKMKGDFDTNLNHPLIDRCRSNLKYFYLNGNFLFEIPKLLLENTKNLELLDLSNNSLAKFSLRSKDLQLKTLRLRYNHIQCDLDCDEVFELKDLHQLRCLDVEGNRIGFHGQNYLKPVLNITGKVFYLFGGGHYSLGNCYVNNEPERAADHKKPPADVVPGFAKMLELLSEYLGNI